MSGIPLAHWTGDLWLHLLEVEPVQVVGLCCWMRSEGSAAHLLAFDALICVFWCVSFGRQFVTQPVIWKEISGGWRWGLFSSFFIFIFYECKRVYSRGPDFPDQGGSISLSMVCLWQSLCFWSVITVIYSCGFPLKGFPLSQSGIFGSVQSGLGVSHSLPLSWYLKLPFLFILDEVGIFLLWNCYFAIELTREDLRPPFLLEVGRWCLICNWKSQVFQTAF